MDLNLRDYQKDLLKFLQPCDSEWWLASELAEFSPVNDRDKVSTALRFFVVHGLMVRRDDRRYCVTDKGISYQLD